MGGLASFHLVREPGWKAPLALTRLAVDRRPMARVEGLRFVRLLGTGRAARTSWGIEPARTAVFAVWEAPEALDAFLAGHPLAARWRRARECWSVRLHATGGHGRWRGVDVVAATAAGPSAPGAPDGPVAVLTRADVRVRRWPRFFSAGRPVSDEVAAAPGLRAVVALGEAPLGRQATFSVWSSAAALRAFAYGRPRHAEVVRRTRAEAWYGEELFARFHPFASTGTWDGRDPLGASGSSIP